MLKKNLYYLSTSNELRKTNDNCKNDDVIPKRITVVMNFKVWGAEDDKDNSKNDDNDQQTKLIVTEKAGICKLSSTLFPL